MKIGAKTCIEFLRSTDFVFNVGWANHVQGSTTGYAVFAWLLQNSSNCLQFQVTYWCFMISKCQKIFLCKKIYKLRNINKIETVYFLMNLWWETHSYRKTKSYHLWFFPCLAFIFKAHFTPTRPCTLKIIMAAYNFDYFDSG